jgi:hypothetical protein
MIPVTIILLRGAYIAYKLHGDDPFETRIISKNKQVLISIRNNSFDHLVSLIKGDKINVRDKIKEYSFSPNFYNDPTNHYFFGIEKTPLDLVILNGDLPTLKNFVETMNKGLDEDKETWDIYTKKVKVDLGLDESSNHSYLYKQSNRFNLKSRGKYPTPSESILKVAKANGAGDDFFNYLEEEMGLKIDRDKVMDNSIAR